MAVDVSPWCQTSLSLVKHLLVLLYHKKVEKTNFKCLRVSWIKIPSTSKWYWQLEWEYSLGDSVTWKLKWRCALSVGPIGSLWCMKCMPVIH